MNKLIFYLIAFVFILYGCDQNENTQLQNVELSEIENVTIQNSTMNPNEISAKVENGVLIFKTSEDFQKARQFVSNSNFNEVQNWYNDLGHESLESHLYTLYDQINTMETEEEILDFVNSNRDHIRINGEYDEREVVPTIDLFENTFSNKHFEFVVGDTKVNLFDFEPIPTNGRSCSNPFEVEYTVNKSGCKRDRRAKMKASAGIFPSFATGVRVDMLQNKMKLWGLRKRACIWVQYRTDCFFHQRPLMTSEFAGATFSPPFNIPTATGCLDCYSHTMKAEVSVIVPPNASPVDIISAYGIGTTRGIGANDIELICND